MWNPSPNKDFGEEVTRVLDHEAKKLMALDTKLELVENEAPSGNWARIERLRWRHSKELERFMETNFVSEK